VAAKPCRQDLCIIPSQNVFLIKQRGKLVEGMMFNLSAGAMNNHQPRLPAGLAWMLRNQFVGKVIVKLGGEHPRSSFPFQSRG